VNVERVTSGAESHRNSKPHPFVPEGVGRKVRI
jgi:hypothetical protein